jgi:hypothetical protein
MNHNKRSTKEKKRLEMHKKCYHEIIKREDHLEDQSVDGRVMLKWIIEVV